MNFKLTLLIISKKKLSTDNIMHQKGVTELSINNGGLKTKYQLKITKIRVVRIGGRDSWDVIGI